MQAGTHAPLGSRVHGSLMTSRPASRLIGMACNRNTTPAMLISATANATSEPRRTSSTWINSTETGAVSVNAVEVAVTDAVNSNAFALSFVNDPGQEDLNVPTPGSAALLGLAGMAAIRRRRK